MMKSFRFFLLFSAFAFAEEREVTEEQQAAVLNGGDVIEETIRPDNLPDLTKGEALPSSKSAPMTWHLGPTGISCIMSGGAVGDQLLVQGTIKGSPAEGKFLRGDVITGINGVKFKAGGNLGITIGNAIIEAEREIHAGKLTFQVWRDQNYPARNATKNIAATDIDQLIDEVAADNSLYDWKPEEERKVEVKNIDFKKFPIDPITLEVELKLRTFPEYADTAPYDCPKTKRILEDAWAALEKKFIPDPQNPRSGRGGIIEAMALVASGKPEHRELVKQWVRSKNCPWQPPTEPIGAMFEPGYKGYKGYQTWHYGFVGLQCALYYDATGDDYVLPALRKYAIEAAMGQSKAGTWGHTFAYPSFNGGKLHEMNPGYGALNAAGNRCFFLVALAKKLGVEHPEIDAAIERAHRFFGSYVDQGAIPYGDHPAAATDDSNGKNAGTAFAMKLIGDDYAAKYFAMMSAHASFTPRGGHAHDYHTQWSSWGATLCGPEVRMLAERNMRWRRTLCRMYDGSFVYHSPTEKYGTLRDPTATEVFHQAVIFKQTLITGKDVDGSLYPTEREMKQFLTSAYGQFNNDYLKNLVGKPWIERSTNELFDLLDIFMPKARKAYATELGKRFQAGESEIAPRLVALLTHENARFRHAALCGLEACGKDAFLSHLSNITPLLEDPKDFVRITAIASITRATQDEEIQLAVLKTAVSDRTALAPNSVRNAVQDSLLKSESAISKTPYRTGIDQAFVTRALTNLILEETGGGPFVASKIGVWDKDTVIRLAGPLTFIAEEEQVYDQMFGARNDRAQRMLSQFGYLEGIQANAHRLRMKAEIPRRIRADAGFKHPLVNPALVLKNPEVFADLTDEIKATLIANPNETITIQDPSNKWRKITIHLGQMLKIIESNKTPNSLPSIAVDATRLFHAELDALNDNDAKIQFCRDALADPGSRHTFRQIAAMDALVLMLDVLSGKALDDLLPYVGSDDWRVRDHSRSLAVQHVKAGAGSALIAAFPTAKSHRTQAGILNVLATANHTPAAALAKKSVNHESAIVRAAAAKAHATLSGAAAIPDLIAYINSTTDRVDLDGCEEALSSFCDEPATAATLRDAILKMIHTTSPNAQATLFYLLARIGDSSSLAALKTFAKQDDARILTDVAAALSYSPSRAADQLMLELAAASPKRADIVSPHAYRRMVIGPKGYGDITSRESIAFADAMLKINLDSRIVKLLGYTPDARALNSLIFCLRNGFGGAAESLVINAESLENLSPEDAKIAAKALQDVIEYIEVTKLRGGVKAHMDKAQGYTVWKALQARAGKALLKFHNPETTPIKNFDVLDLDR
ncbi:MAG: hypothetical protein RL346_944 [Verrucomicrobiota bacterium]